MIKQLYNYINNSSYNNIIEGLIICDLEKLKNSKTYILCEDEKILDVEYDPSYKHSVYLKYISEYPYLV